MKETQIKVANLEKRVDRLEEMVSTVKECVDKVSGSQKVTNVLLTVNFTGIIAVFVAVITHIAG